MPYKSDQQRKYFHWAEKEGKIKKSTVDEFDQASQGLKLPKKVLFKTINDKLKKK